MSTHPLRTAVNQWTRKLHRWGVILTILPLAVVIGTGILLQLKKQWAWVQPPTQRGTGDEMSLTFAEILAAARSAPEAGIESWDDVDRLDVRPGKGVVKVRGANRWEVQVDTATGEVLQVEYRRSDLIESLHDGSWFGGDLTKLVVFLPSGVVLLGLWMTGVYLWIIPYSARRRARLRASAARAHHHVA
jgi:uncharacterized iron-regulated membrane protein